MNRFRLRLMLATFFVLISCSATQGAFAFDHWAPMYRAKDVGKEQIRDDQGRVYYIIDLAEGSDEPYVDVIIEGRTRPMASRHSPKFRNLVTDLVETYGFEDLSATSWVGLSVSAYLDEATANKLRHDHRVTMLTEVTEIGTSSAPPWQDNPTPLSDFYSALPNQVQSWGRTAVNGNKSIVNGATSYNEQVGYVAYVLDTGVGDHVDLNVGRWVNASCYDTIADPSSAGNDCTGYPITDPRFMSPVGCWAHSTHVAGIIGAKENGQGVSGVNAGMKIVSVAATNNWAYWYDSSTPIIACGVGRAITGAAFDTVSVVAALDWIRNDIFRQNRYRPGIVNMSMNAPDFATFPTLKNKMLALASGQIGGVHYAGAFIVQSAGNHRQDACIESYNQPSTTDGIMVVGAIDESGTPVTTQFNPSIPGEKGSNYGSCVEVWAPGIRVLSTWSDRPLANPDCLGGKCQHSGVTYTGYQKLGGTSMAAPHIAGVAAYLAETRGLTSAPAIEVAVRQYMYTLGAKDLSGRNVYMVRLP